MCEKLYLKAESQQIDRILVEFSRWYWENNPTSLYRSAGGLSLVVRSDRRLTPLRTPDIVHAVSYSLLLLNTDLHVVDSTVRMSRRAFVANILHTINEQACPEILTSALLFGPNTTDEPESNNVFGGGEASASHRSVDRIRDGISHLSKRSGSVHSWKSGRDSAALSTFGTPSPTRSKASVVSPSGHDAVRSPSLATITAGRAADAEIEPMLKVGSSFIPFAEQYLTCWAGNVQRDQGSADLPADELNPEPLREPILRLAGARRVALRDLERRHPPISESTERHSLDDERIVGREIGRAHV